MELVNLLLYLDQIRALPHLYGLDGALVAERAAHRRLREQGARRLLDVENATRAGLAYLLPLRMRKL